MPTETSQVVTAQNVSTPTNVNNMQNRTYRQSQQFRSVTQTVSHFFSLLLKNEFQLFYRLCLVSISWHRILLAWGECHFSFRIKIVFCLLTFRARIQQTFLQESVNMGMILVGDIIISRFLTKFRSRSAKFHR